jgi:hypothetical protein
MNENLGNQGMHHWPAWPRFSFNCHFRSNKDKGLYWVSNESLFSVDHGADLVFKDSSRFSKLVRNSTIVLEIAIFENGYFFLLTVIPKWLELERYIESWMKPYVL